MQCTYFLEGILNENAFQYMIPYQKIFAQHRRAIRATQNPSTPENVTKKKIKSTVTAIVIISSLLGCYFFFVIFYFDYAVTGQSGNLGIITLCKQATS